MSNNETRRILLVEDEKAIRDAVTAYLERENYWVTAVGDGQEALEAFANSQLDAIDAILMDMQMPVMDGCEATRAIRALDREDAVTVPIVAVTANAFAEDIAKTTEAGMNGHVAKPFTVEELTDVLGKLMK